MVWDARRQEWKPVSKSTRCRDEAKALEVAREYERVALAAGGPMAASSLSRDFVVGVINDILRISGHRDIEDTKRWDTYSKAWLESAKKRIPTSLSLGTWRTYQSHIQNLTKWLGAQAKLSLGAITGEMMQEWYRAGIETGLSATTMNNTSTTISTIFERAKDEGFATRNPVNLIDRDDHEGNTRDPFTAEDMEKILTYLRSDKSHSDWLTVALLGLCTSQRLSDCAKATRGQFEQGSPFWVWDMRQGKTGKKMRIPIVEPLTSHLMMLWKKPADSLFLAPSLAPLPSGGFQGGLSWQFAKILKEAGVQGRKVKGKGKGRGFHSKTFHSTRHTCNSLLANAGVPADVRRMITGHSDDATNLIYTHFDDKTKAKALNKAFAPQKKKKG
jgi:integrase